jgi:hypothetical protein
LKAPTSLLLVLGLSTAASGCALAAAPAACSPPPVATEVDPDREAGADYWTPERMRSARPVETHPDGPIDDEDDPLACPTESRTAPGRPGSGEIVPDEGNDPGRIDPRSSE